MDKLTSIKIKYDDGTYSDEIPVSVLSENVEWDSTHTLVDVLGSIDVDVTGTIQDQISQLFNEKVSSSDLNNYVANQLNADVTTWLQTNVNPVGSAVVVDKSLTIEGAAADAKMVGDNIINLKKDINDNYYFPILIPNKYILRDNGQEANSNGWSATDFISVLPQSLILYYGSTNLVWGAKYNSNKEYIEAKSWDTQFNTFFNDTNDIVYFRTSGSNTDMANVKFQILSIVDISLTKTGYPADAKTVGDKINIINNNLRNLDLENIKIELQSRDLTSIISNNPIFFANAAECGYRQGESYRYSLIGEAEIQTNTDYILYCGKMITPTNTGKIQLYITYTDSSVTRIEVVNDSKYKHFNLKTSKTIQSCILYAISVNGEAVTSDGIAKFANIYIFEGENLEFRSIFNLPTPENPTPENNDDIPNYYITHLTNKEAVIREHEKDCSFNGDSLVFLTDTHHSADYAINDNKKSNFANANHSVSLIKDVIKNTATRLICFGGDLINSSDGIDEMIHGINCYGEKYKEDKYRLRYCVGNHEYFTDFNQTVQNRPSAEWLYGGFTKYNEDVILGKTEMATYYFDNAVQKIRYFVISCGRDTETTIAQMAWVMNEFTKVPANYHIVCIGHAFMVDMMNGFRGYYKNIMEALDAVKNKTTYLFNNITYDYSSLDNVEVVCVITGHTHIDGYLMSTNNIPCICTTCDSYKQNYEIQNGSLVNVPRIKDTIEEHAFDVFQFDFTNKKIYCTRIGYGSDREFSY